MFSIDTVEIQGFWGKYEAQGKFRNDVNILIGRNGTGKTTFMNLLEAALRADFKRLSAMEFEVLTVKLKEGSRSRTIKVTKSNEEELKLSRFPTIEYRIGTSRFVLPILSTEYTRRNAMSGFQREYEGLRKRLENIIRVASLSVHRNSRDLIEDQPERLVRTAAQNSPIDIRLKELMHGLTGYQLVLSERASDISIRLQREVLQSMLYDKNFDSFRFGELDNVNAGKQKLELINAFKELGAFGPGLEERIGEHVDVLGKSIEAVSSFSSSQNLNINDIMPFPLLKRTQHIIELSRKSEGDKRGVFRPIRKFEEIVRSFMPDKDIRIESNGDLIIKKEGKDIAIYDLSSGEKQLLILLTETLLQRDQPFVFLADEPELSLHISWQAKIISSIKELNVNAQIIVATHSPEVAGEWSDCIIDMEDIIHA